MERYGFGQALLRPFVYNWQDIRRRLWNWVSGSSTRYFMHICRGYVWHLVGSKAYTYRLHTYEDVMTPGWTEVKMNWDYVRAERLLLSQLTYR